MTVAIELPVTTPAQSDAVRAAGTCRFADRLWACLLTDWRPPALPPAAARSNLMRSLLVNLLMLMGVILIGFGCYKLGELHGVKITASPSYAIDVDYQPGNSGNPNAADAPLLWSAEAEAACNNLSPDRWACVAAGCGLCEFDASTPTGAICTLGAASGPLLSSRCCAKWFFLSTQALNCAAQQE